VTDWLQTQFIDFMLENVIRIRAADDQLISIVKKVALA
jgi:hypothetical protein